MEKAQLTYEQAKVLKERIASIGKSGVARCYLNGEYSDTPYFAINTILSNDFFKAIANGWEIKLPKPPNFALANGVQVHLNTGLDSALKGVSRPIFATIKTSIKEVNVGLEVNQAKELIYQLTGYVNFLEKYGISTPNKKDV
jgi:hypothetical protein